MVAHRSHNPEPGKRRRKLIAGKTIQRAVSLLIPVIALLWAPVAMAAHAMALGYEPKYGPGFSHFDYVDPNAPKGGTVVLSVPGAFDSLNPYLLKGIAAAGIANLVFETLSVESWDEPFTAYGLLADDIALAPDGLSVTYHINSKARFSDASPVTAQDVKHSFDTLTGKTGHPLYQSYWSDVKRVVVVDGLTVRFEFAKVNAELHMIVGQLPVFSRKWGGGKSFDKVVIDAPIGSGPYVLDSYDLGKRVSYKRNPDYWGKDLGVRRGAFNFDRVAFRYYRDEVVRLEAFKAGEFDWNMENSAKQWAKGYVGDKFDRGLIKKAEFKHGNSAGMQGFGFNLRHSLFKDQRVRRALGLAFDFEWSNKNLFFGQYTRDNSYFSNSELASSGILKGPELALLEPFRAQLPAEVFTSAWRPPSTDPPGSLRANLREAKALLESAGWRVSDGVLRNTKGEPFVFEMLLTSKVFERIVAPYARNLKQLGVTMNYRVVDAALYQRRLDKFEFDVTVVNFGASQSPGNELLGRFGSKSADEEGSENHMGIKDPVVDALIQRILAAPDRRALVEASRAFDRVMLQGDYVSPNWYSASHRVAYFDKFAYPKTLPKYYNAMNWMLEVWWAKGG
jgi:microcin C transport system substrate-binding protein